MRNLVKFSLLALVALSATVASAAELEFHGYARAGFGLNSQGGGQVAFGLSTADTKFRLGNEADVCIEPDFEYSFVTLEDKSKWGVHWMPALYRTFASPAFGTDGTDHVTSTGYEDLPVYFKQIYFYGSNVPQLLNGQIWAGRRYWDRLQTGINDQFLENHDGDGFGIQDMNLGGFAKWTISWLMNPYGNGKAVNQESRISTHFTGIQTFSKDAALQVWFDTQLQSKNTGVATDDGLTTHIGVYHTWNLGDWGSNLFGGAYNTNKNNNTWRVVFQHGFVFTSVRTGLDFLTEYRSSKSKDVDAANWFAIGARSDTQLSGPFRFLLEAGLDMTKQGANGGDNKTHQLIKVTPAFAVSGGNDPWSRPTFRVFYTFASWNKDSIADMANHWQNTYTNPDGSTGSRFADAFQDKTSGSTFGVQAEGWW